MANEPTSPLHKAAILALPFEPYRPVRRQLFEIVRLVNRRRKLAGLPLVSGSAVRWHRQIYRPFDPISGPTAFAEGPSPGSLFSE